jgi:hypothetical protein
MPGKNENSNTGYRYGAIIIAFVVTCFAHALILFAAAWILRERVGVIDWRLQWYDAAMLGSLAVVWRIWLRQRT